MVELGITRIKSMEQVQLHVSTHDPVANSQVRSVNQESQHSSMLLHDNLLPRKWVPKPTLAPFQALDHF